MPSIIFIATFSGANLATTFKMFVLKEVDFKLHEMAAVCIDLFVMIVAFYRADFCKK